MAGSLCPSPPDSLFSRSHCRELSSGRRRTEVQPVIASMEDRAMTRRQLLQTSLAAPLLRTAAASPANSSKVLKNMGSAGPGLGARIQAMGKSWDIVEYCREK